MKVTINGVELTIDEVTLLRDALIVSFNSLCDLLPEEKPQFDDGKPGTLTLQRMCTFETLCALDNEGYPFIKKEQKENNGEPSVFFDDTRLHTAHAAMVRMAIEAQSFFCAEVRERNDPAIQEQNTAVWKAVDKFRSILYEGKRSTD